MRFEIPIGHDDTHRHPGRPPRWALAPAFEPPTREAWLELVDKVLKGGDFEKRLVARTADGLAMPPLATRADGAGAAPIAKKPAISRAAGTSASAMPSPIQACQCGDPGGSAGGVTSLLLQIMAPGQSGISYSAEALSAALKGVFLNGCTSRSMRARTPWTRPAA